MPSFPVAATARSTRSARLEARLALYAQYAAIARSEVAAAWSADPALAAGVPRALAEARAALAEQYDELRSAHHAAGVAAFGDAYGDAVAELDAQLAHDRALRTHVEDAARGAALGAVFGASFAPRALSAPRAAPPTDADRAEGVERAESVLLRDELSSLGRALVDARTAGVGGALDGRYPGVDPTSYGVDADAGEDAGERRVDVRF